MVTLAGARPAQDLSKDQGVAGLRYDSVRSPGNPCWALLTPRPVTAIQQTAHYEMTWNQRIVGVSRLAGMEGR